MHLKTILNRVQKFKSFVYGTVRWVEDALVPTLELNYSRAGTAVRCVVDVGARGSGYDTLQARRIEFIPLWGIKVFFLYAPRRVVLRNVHAMFKGSVFKGSELFVQGVRVVDLKDLTFFSYRLQQL